MGLGGRQGEFGESYSLVAVQIAILLQTYAQMQLAGEQNVTILIDVAQKGTHRRSELQYYCRRMHANPVQFSSVSSICYDFPYFGADGQHDFHHVGTHRRSELQYYCRRMPKRCLFAVQIAILLQTYAQMQLAGELNVSISLDVKQKSAPRPKKKHISLDVAQKGTHQRSE